MTLSIKELNMSSAILTFEYTNWQGRTAIRRARPMRISLGSTQHHPEQQWLMEAWDVDRMEMRTFAMKDMRAVEKEPARIEPLLKAISDFLCLPNWENRCGPWADIHKALRSIIHEYGKVATNE